MALTFYGKRLGEAVYTYFVANTIRILCARFR